MEELNMKKIYVVCALAGAILSLGGCIEENFEDTIKVTKGDEVVFNASANFEKSGAETRTEYSGDVNGGFERVNWMKGDQVYIFCDHEDGDQEAHYVIEAVGAETSGSNTHSATLKKNSKYNPNGISWQDTDKTHTFYAVYPAPNTFLTGTDEQDKNTYSAHLSLADNTVEGFIPVNQDPIAWVDGNGKPNMDYAYMIAKQEVKKNSDGSVNAVNLQFRPIVTAVEFTLTAAEETEISTVQIFSNDGKPICGPFNSDLSKYNPAGSYPVCTVGSLDGQRYTGLDFSQINVSLYKMDANGDPISASLTLSANSSITFTVFMLPVDIANLSIRVNAHDVYKTAKLGVSFEAHKKHFVKNLALPSKPVTEGDPNNWISQLNPATMIGGLSIPGSANSFSYAYPYNSGSWLRPSYNNSVDKDATDIVSDYMTQTLKFENQWARGVRCFELVSTRAGSNGASNSLANAQLRCANETLGITISEAVDKIWSKVNGTEEFAMVIFTYQPTGSDSDGGARDAVAYVNQLNAYYESLNIKTKTYSPDLCVGDCKGHIMFIARPTQEGEDDDVNVVAGGDILTIKGWGSLTDKWTKRGYPTRLYAGTTAYSIGNGSKYNDISGNAVGYEYGEDKLMEEYIYGKKGTQPQKGERDFTYQTSLTGMIAWVQEWRRVYSKDYNSNVGGFNWFDSYTEKFNDAVDAYERSIARVDGMVYINSLDGFFITNNSDSYMHYWKGNLGDIRTFASRINNDFYKEVLNRGAANGTGPMGVVIMDYIGDSDGGESLPKVIIDNNFKSPPPINPSYKDE